MAYEKGTKTTSNNPNKGGSRGAKMVAPSMSESKSGSINKASDMRSDGAAKTTNSNPYPNGLS